MLIVYAKSLNSLLVTRDGVFEVGNLKDLKAGSLDLDSPSKLRIAASQLVWEFFLV